MAAATIAPPSSSSMRSFSTSPTTQGIRRIPPTPVTAMPPPPPIPEKYHSASNSAVSTLSASVPPLTPNQVITLAREAMNHAVQENESQAAEASGVSNELKPGITIDLSRKKIQELPDEVVDIFKHELERLVKLAVRFIQKSRFANTSFPVTQSSSFPQQAIFFPG